MLPVWGAYIWRGLYTEGLIFGILRYLPEKILTKAPSWEGGEGARIHNDS